MESTALNLSNSWTLERNKNILPKSRKGKWSMIENEYTNFLINAFTSGLLDLDKHTSLRLFLAEKLKCDPMRISKKYAGSICVGRTSYHPVAPTEGNLRLMESVKDKIKVYEKILWDIPRNDIVINSNATHTGSSLSESSSKDDKMFQRSLNMKRSLDDINLYCTEITSHCSDGVYYAENSLCGRDIPPSNGICHKPYRKSEHVRRMYEGRSFVHQVYSKAVHESDDLRDPPFAHAQVQAQAQVLEASEALLNFVKNAHQKKSAQVVQHNIAKHDLKQNLSPVRECSPMKSVLSCAQEVKEASIARPVNSMGMDRSWVQRMRMANAASFHQNGAPFVPPTSGQSFERFSHMKPHCGLSNQSYSNLQFWTEHGQELAESTVNLQSTSIPTADGGDVVYTSNGPVYTWNEVDCMGVLTERTIPIPRLSMYDHSMTEVQTPHQKRLRVLENYF